MKKLSRVFIILGMLCSVVLIVLGLIFLIMKKTVPVGGADFSGWYYVGYGFYGILTGIAALIAVNGTAKWYVVLAGAFFIPVMALASIFMFCIKPEDLN